MDIKGIKGKRIIYSIFALLIVFFCVGLSTLGYFYDYIEKFNDGNAENLAPKTVKDKKSPITILLLGMDVGDAKQANKEEIKRTDSIIAINYNPVNDKMNIISIPRDILIKINGKNSKINAAYPIGGINYVVEAVEDILGVKVNYYAKVDYTGFRKVIDALGGIEMYIKRDMYYDDEGQNLHIRFKKGETVLLDGKKAEEFFRWRKNNDGTGLSGGDLERIENQHLFLSKVIDKFKSPAIITKVKSILDIIPKHVTTNMPGDDIVQYGLDFVKMNKSNIVMRTIKGKPQDIDGISYLIYDEKQNQELLDTIGSK